ncbi:hypothetical protein Trydic_g21640 [Trypoxylus dichotomus]
MKLMCLICFVIETNFWLELEWYNVFSNPNLCIAEDNAIAFLDCVREMGYTADEEFAIPVLDPLRVEEAYSNLAVDVGTMGLSRTARFINAFSVDILDFEYAAVSRITLRFPKIQASIEQCDSNIVYNYTNLYGLARINFETTDLYALLKFCFTGLFNDEEYSQQVSGEFLNNPGTMANIAGTIDAACLKY